MDFVPIWTEAGMACASPASVWSRSTSRCKFRAYSRDKILYGLKDSGHITVSLVNATGDPQPAHLTVKIESGLDQAVKIYDADITIAAPAAAGDAQTVTSRCRRKASMGMPSRRP